MADEFEIVDYDLASTTERNVDRIEVIPQREVEQAAQEVVDAAVAARRREFITDSQASGYDADGVLRDGYMDTTTGDFYVPIEDGRYQNTTTGQEIDGDPTEVGASEYQWILDEFTYFHERWPAYPRTMAQHCMTARTAIESSELSTIGGVQDLVSAHWGGRTRDHFRDYFLVPFGNAVSNQQLLLDELAQAMFGYEAVLRKGRLKAREIANKTVTSLDSVDAYGGGGDVGLALGIAGVALGVITTVASGGSAGMIALGLLGSAVSAGQLVEGELSDDSEGGDQRTIAGETVDQVLQSMREVLEALRSAMDTEEEILAGYLSDTSTEVGRLLGSESNLEAATVLPNEPTDDGVTNVTGGEVPSPDEFRPRT